LDCTQAAAVNGVLKALQGLDVAAAGARLTPKARVTRRERGAWARFGVDACAVALAPSVIDGRPVSWPDEPIGPLLPDALAHLGELETVIAALERSMATPLEILDIGPPPALQFELDLRAGGALRHRLGVAVSVETALAWPTPACRPFPPPRLAALRSPGRLRIPGPLAPRAELNQLQRGDLVLVPPAGERGWPAQFRPARSQGWFEGRFDPRKKLFQVAFWREAPLAELDITEIAGGLAPDVDLEPAPERAEDTPPEPPPETEVAQRAWSPDVPVRLQIEFAELSASVSDLLALAPGYVLPLTTEEPEIHVQVTAGGLWLASGQLVALGDGYGVLVDRVEGERS
jgi:flagellar motor switch/type III secretory pathway protein FliN